MRTLEIVHRTRYEYSEPVTLGDHRLMFRPRDSHDLRLLHTGLVIDPAAQVRWIHDPFGNSIAIAAFEGTTPVLERVRTIELEQFGGPPELPPATTIRPAESRAMSVQYIGPSPEPIANPLEPNDVSRLPSVPL